MLTSVDDLIACASSIIVDYICELIVHMSVYSLNVFNVTLLRLRIEDLVFSAKSWAKRKTLKVKGNISGSVDSNVHILYGASFLVSNAHMEIIRLPFTCNVIENFTRGS